MIRSTNTSRLKFDAFISYSHAADGKLAPAVQRALHALARPWYKLRALRVFRDETNLSASPELFPSIQRALDESRYFILFASLEAAKSSWVDRELQHWLAHRSTDTVLLVLTDGVLKWKDHDFDYAVSTALPRALRGRFKHEPLFVDLSWARSENQLSIRNTRFRDQVLCLAAAIHGQDKDDLDGEDVRQFRRSRRYQGVAASTLLVFLIVTGVALLAERHSRHAAQQRQLEAESRLLTLQSKSILEHTKVAWAAIPSAMDAVLRTWTYGYALPEAVTALQEALEGTSDLKQVFSQDEAAIDTDWNPNGRELVSVTSAGHAEIWDLGTGTSTRLPATTSSFQRITWSPDGTRLLATHLDRRISVWNAKTLELTHSFPPQDTQALTETDARWSPDGQRLLIVDDEARVWDAQFGKPVGAPLHHNVHVADWSPDGNHILTASADHTARVWAVTTSRQRFRLPPTGYQAYDVWNASWSPRGDRLATVTCRLPVFEVSIWDASNGRLLHTLQGHTGHINALEWNPDGTQLATASDDTTARIWDTSFGRETHRLDGHKGKVTFANWNVDGTKLITGGADNFVAIWDPIKGSLLTRIEAQNGHGRFSPAGQRLATIGHDGSLYVWREPGSAEPVAPGITMAEMNIDHSKLATVSPRTDIAFTFAIAQRVAIWTPGENTQPIELEGDLLGVSCLRWNPTGTRLFVGAGSGSGVWSAVTGSIEVESSPWDPDRAVLDASWSPDGSQIVAAIGYGRWDGSAAAGAVAEETAIWDATTGKLLRAFAVAAHRVAWSPDGHRIATIDAGRRLQVWQVTAGEKEEFSHEGIAHGPIAWNPSGTRLAAVSDDRRINIWSILQQRKVLTLKEEVSPDIRIAWSPSGQFLAGSDGERVLRIWETEMGTLTQEILGTSVGTSSVLWAPQGSEVLVLSPEGRVRRLHVGIGHLLDVARSALANRP